MESLILVANPGSASRKYALYKGGGCLAKLHFEHDHEHIVYSLNDLPPRPAGISHITFTAGKAWDIFSQELSLPAKPDKIGLRIVAPSDFFQQDREIDEPALNELERLESEASLHINTTLQEIHLLRQTFPRARIIGVSDSAFHKTMPKPASTYAIPHHDAEKFGIKRYGYHGLSVEAAVSGLKEAGQLPLRLVVCHLGSGSSVTAIKDGRSLDTTMGFSPLEGLVMATRSGSLDVTAAQAIQASKHLDGAGLQSYLNHQSGLLGVSGQSSDIRQLLELEKSSDQAKLALEMYVYHIQCAIGRMAAALGGIDSLVFTGTVGERSAEIRKRTIKHLMFLGLALDSRANHSEIKQLTRISPEDHPAKIYVVPTDEGSVIAARVQKFS